ncbi:substrate-binding domain-containing protein [Dysgonomonas reticulitermitis]
MIKKYRIKDIAELAGVSTGTVDRVIHNRGEVSLESRKKVEEILTRIDYYNGSSLLQKEKNRRFRVLAILPQHTDGDYWHAVKKGIEHVAYYSTNIELKLSFLYYNQFDMYSCREIFNKALSLKSNAILIGPSFYDETLLFANQLFIRDIPYVFIDTSVENTKPLAFFGPHPYQTGVVQAKLLTAILENGKDIALFQAKRVGDKTSMQSLTRSYGFITYLKENFPLIKVYSGEYDYGNKKESDLLLDRLFNGYHNIGGAVVFDTKGYLIAEYLKERNIANIKLIGFGTSKKNIACLKEGTIDFLISERPEYQGEAALRIAIDYLLYNKTANIENYTPIDILIKETIDFY